MPKQIHNNYYPDEDDPVYQNLNEIYNKTSTTEDDWKPVIGDIKVWLRGKDLETFRDDESKNLADEFVAELSQKYDGKGLFDGLRTEPAVRNALYCFVKRTAYNERRKLLKQARRSASTASTLDSEVQGMQAVSSVRMDAPAPTIRTNYNDHPVRLRLPDILDTNDVQLGTEDLIKRVTLRGFLRAVCEEFEVDDSDKALEYTYPGDPTSTPLRSDKAIRAAVQHAVGPQEPHGAFQMVQKSSATGGMSIVPVESATPSAAAKLESSRDASTASTQGSKRALEGSPGVQSESGVQGAAKKLRLSVGHTSASPSLSLRGGPAIHDPMESPGEPANQPEPLSSNTLDSDLSNRSAADSLSNSSQISSATFGNNLASMEAGDTQGLLLVNNEGDTMGAVAAKDAGAIGQSQVPLPANSVIDLTADTAVYPKLMTLCKKDGNLDFRTKLLNRMNEGFTRAREQYDEKDARRQASLVSGARITAEETGTEEELGHDETDEQLRKNLSSVWPSAVTEHLNQGDNRWEDCCRLFLLDPEKSKDTNIGIKIYGMTTEFHPFQVFGIFVLFEMGMWQGGGYLADEMGLGKTLQTLGLIALNRALVMTIRDVRSARKRKRYHLHLKEGTSDDPQPADARCPSNNPYGIQCTCVDAGISKVLEPSFGPNLLIVPAGLFSTWGTHMRDNFDKEAEGCGWKIRRAHGDNKFRHLGDKLTLEDYDLMEPNSTAPYFTPSNDSSNMIVLTTTGSYDGHVRDILAENIPPVPKIGRNTGRAARTRPYLVVWGLIAVDEAHREHNQTSGAINRIRKMNAESAGQLPRKILITGTPFEATPAHMAYWVRLIDGGTWASAYTPRPDYPRMNEQQKNLARCTCDELLKLGKDHETLVKAPRAGKLDKDNYKTHKDNMTIVVQTLWLRRTKDSNFMGYKLIEYPPNHHLECSLQYPTSFKDTFEEAFTEVQKTVQDSYNKSVAESKKSIARQPVIAAQVWLQAARRARILSSFPALADNEDTKGLSLSLEELREKKWICTEKGKMYKLAQMNSPYENNIREFAGRINCTKMYALELLMANRWGKNEKLVVMTMGPVSALILYWAFRLLWKKPVALIHSGQSKAKVADIVQLFQEGKDGPKSEHEDDVPQILVGSTTLINVGLTLTAAKHVVIWDSEWLYRDELQGIGRCSRMGQTEVTETIKFINASSKLDMAITDRHGARLEMYEGVTGPVEQRSYEDIREGQEEHILAADNKQAAEQKHEEVDEYDKASRQVAE